ncbi:MAG: hypothetical protein JWP91_4383 [Fibrobacteres bacterium]|nr:hypothetical protein [Fibrobacterota bacterium]
MRKALVGIAVACGLGFSQTVPSKLAGKRVYVLREWVDGGHQNGFQALKDLVEANAKVYGYTAEVPANPLNQTDLNAVFARLYKGDGTKPANAIDVMVFSQGEGDWNVTGNPLIGGADVRMSQINAHVRGGGGLIITHAAAGREISRSGWIFGAKLMGDWFQDEYSASASISGNGGHFGSGTAGTTTFDEETLASKDSSTFFIRNVMTLSKDKKGYGMPSITDQVTGEWYHFNGGYKYEDGTGGKVTNPNNKFQPVQVRGHQGYPDSGIGPTKIISVLTKIQGANYTPPGKGRLSVWAREVSKGTFDKNASATNGRFVYFNPGHAGDEFTKAGGWMGSLWISSLRWVVKDDRGCTQPTSSNYNPLATVNDATCIPTSIGRDALLTDDKSALLGRVSVDASSIGIAVNQEGPHSLKVIKMNGELVFQHLGTGAREYRVPGLKSGFYMVLVNVNGRSFKKSAFIP